MRETTLQRDDQVTKVVTDDRGTTVLDAGGFVVREHGADLHEATVADLAAEGWRAVADGHAAPAAVADAPPPAPTPAGDGAAGDPTGTVNPTTG